MNTIADSYRKTVTGLGVAVGAVVLVTALAVQPAAAAEVAGKVLLAKGEVQAQAVDGSVRSLKKGAELFTGDTIRTEDKSYIVVRFTDGGKVTVRPGTELVIDEYAYGGDSDGSTLKLVKGGLRALTGAIAKQNPDAYRINTPVATLGVRGTEFDVRLCEADCEPEQQLVAYGAPAEQADQTLSITVPTGQ